MSFSSYADALLKKTDELLSNLFTGPGSDDEDGQEFIPPPPSHPPPQSALKAVIEEGGDGEEDDEEVVEENDLVYKNNRPLSAISKRNTNTAKQKPRSISIQSTTDGVTDGRNSLSENASNSNSNVASVFYPKQNRRLEPAPPASNEPVASSSRAPVSVSINTNSAAAVSSSTSQAPPVAQRANSEVSSTWGGSRAPSEASSMWSSSSFTSQSGRLSRILLPSYPLFERDWLIEPAGMEPVQKCKVNRSSILREVLLLDDRRMLKLRKKFLASKLFKIFDWLQSALKGPHAVEDAWLVFHFCEVLDLLQCIDVCCVVVDAVRMMRFYKFDTNDIQYVFAAALSSLEHVLGTRSGSKMGSLERGYVGVLQVYLSHTWLLDHFIPLGEWHARLFRGFCDKSMLRGTMVRLWGLRDFRLGVNEDDVNKKRNMLCRFEDAVAWTDESIQREAMRVSLLPPVQLVGLGAAGSSHKGGDETYDDNNNNNNNSNNNNNNTSSNTGDNNAGKHL